MPDDSGVTVTLNSATKGAFGEIQYQLSDAGKTFTYTISETGQFGAGWTASGPVTATVHVVDNQRL